MANRTRNNRIVFRVSDKERDLIEQKMEFTGIQNREAYLRKMAIDGLVVRLDLSDIKDFVPLLGNISNNINQIAKRTNETNNFYKQDVAEIKKNYEKIWDTTRATLRKLSEI
jgi:alpha/beta superfamily hydrolase